MITIRMISRMFMPKGPLSTTVGVRDLSRTGLPERWVRRANPLTPSRRAATLQRLVTQDGVRAKRGYPKLGRRSPQEPVEEEQLVERLRREPLRLGRRAPRRC